MLTMFVAACQTEPEEPKGPQTYTTEFTITESHKIPTAVKWSTGNDSADASLVTSGTNLYRINIPLASPPNNPVNVDLFRAGLLYYRLRFDYTGTTALTLNSGALAPNDVAIELLKRLGDKANDSSVAAEVARALIDNDTLVKSDLILAGKLPGLDTAKVVQEALKLLAAKNLPLKELVPSGKWILNIDTLSIHVRMRDLSLSGTIVVDTNKLFPPYPVRVTQALAITGEIQAGGSALAVSGVFEATNKLVTNSVKIFHENEDATAGFDFPVNFDLLDQPSKLDLSGKLSIAAKPTTAAGTYRLEIILKDQDAFFAKATLEFQVVTRPADTGSTPAKDTIKPKILRQAGTENREVAYDVSEIAVGWTVSDASPLKVTIQGAPVTAKDGAYTATVVLGNATTVIRIRATDSANNEATDSVIIRRGSEPGAPVVTREPGTKDSAVAYSVTSLKLAWKISDATQVTLNGSPVQGVDGIYTIQVGPLKVGANGYKILAKNATGKESSDTITISRAYHDSIFPVAVAENGTKDTTVPNATDKISLSWKVIDNDKLQTVTIGGLAATVVGDIYSAILPLKPGENVFELIATDTAKNTTKKSVTVIRTPDAGAPVIVREAGTKDSTVAYATTAIKLSWKVTDDVGVASVEINGSVVTGTAGIYSIDAKNLAIGKNGFRIEAKDAGGKSSFDTLTIIRIGDTSAPKIARDAGTKDSTVAYGTTSIKLSWKVTDDVGVSSVEINGTVVTGTDGVYSLDAKNLAIGKNGFKIIAKDVLGKTSSDSLTIVRAWKDTIAPSIVRQTGTGPQTVVHKDSIFSPAWGITDNHKTDSVLFQGVRVAIGANGVFSTTAVLKVGANNIVLRAIDSTGNYATDSFVVVRLNAALAIAAGGYHSLALRDDGTVEAWGANNSSQATVPNILNNDRVVAIAAGMYHSLALRDDGTVGAWGSNDYAQAAVPKTLNNGKIVAIAAGGYHNLVLRDDGTVGAWGANNSGQATVSDTLNNSKVVAIAAGGYHNLVLRDDGTVVAWGENGSGQATVPTTLNSRKVVAIAAGMYHSLALLDDGTIVAWGENGSGQATVPTTLNSGKVVAIAAGMYHSLALLDDGTVVGWGDHIYDQATAPETLNNGKTVAIAAGYAHSLALLDDGTVVAWGYKNYGQTTVPLDLGGTGK